MHVFAFIYKFDVSSIFTVMLPCSSYVTLVNRFVLSWNQIESGMDVIVVKRFCVNIMSYILMEAGHGGSAIIPSLQKEP